MIKEEIKFSIGFCERIFMDKHEDSADQHEPKFKHVENWDRDPNDNWEGSFLVFQRLSDNKFFRGDYVMRFDGDIRSASEVAIEVEKKPVTTYIYE